MDFQNYQETQPIQPIPQNQPVTYEPYYPPPNNQAYPTQLYENNSQPNQFYQSPQYQIPNNNVIYQSPQYQIPNNNVMYQQEIIPNNQYNSVPQEPLITPLKDNILEIPFEKTQKKYIFFIFMFSSIILNFLPTIVLIQNIFSPILLIIEILIFLYLENYKIVIIKDESENKLYFQLLNYLFIKRKKLTFNLDDINFSVTYTKKKYILVILNNCRKGGEIDLNASRVRNTPLQFLYSFENIDVNKFQGQFHLKSILDNFSKNKENPLNFNINTYMNKRQLNLNQYIKYIKINDHFFTYYNNDPLKKYHHIDCLFKGTSITIQIFLLCLILPSVLVNDKDDDVYYIMAIELYMFYVISIFIGLCICMCRNIKKCLRVDIIYSYDFDKIFIGTSINGQNRYITKSELFINEIDRFILKKNKINEAGFHLKVIFKGNTEKELCYIKDQQQDLEGLVYILNEKKVGKIDYNNSNVEQQLLSDCPTPIGTAGN